MFGPFLDLCSSIVGDDNVEVEVDFHAVSGEQRRIAAIIRPASTNEVLAIVDAANSHKIPIYPVSTGKSWGMGSTLPVQDGCVVVSLKRMNSTREINARAGYAVIEAGVTQGQLSDQLSGSGFYLDATGSGRHTSIIGCALDRGVAYNTHRSDSILGLEVVLGKGELIRTGFGHYPNAVASHLYRDGLGPSLDGLFAQSNYGIVTAATVNLKRVPDYHCCFIGKIPNEDALTKTVEGLQLLKQKGLISCVPHIANRARTLISLAPAVREFYATQGKNLSREQVEAIILAQLPTEWSIIGSLSGSRSHMTEGKKELRRTMHGIGSVVFVDDTLLTVANYALRLASFLPLAESMLAFVSSSQEVFGMTKGIPSNSALRSVYWPLVDSTADYTNPDRGEAGLLYCLPIIPADDLTVRSALSIIYKAFSQHGFVPYITLNLLDGVLEGVVNLSFDRRQGDSAEKAHRCIDELLDELIKNGLYPYRVGIGQMSRVVCDDTFWQTAQQIKRALDPNGIISPGRYSLE